MCPCVHVCRKLEYGPCLAVLPAARATSSGPEQTVLLLLTTDKLYLLDCVSNTLQQHFNIGESKLEKKDASKRGQVEVHVIPNLISPEKDVLSPTNFQTVEYYLKLSQMEEAQALPVTASSSSVSNNAAPVDDGADECDVSSNVVLLIDEREASSLLSTFQSIRNHILEPELSFCVYSSPKTGSKEDSFFSVFSHPTV